MDEDENWLSFCRLPGLLYLSTADAPDPLALALDWPEEGWQPVAWTLPARSSAVLRRVDAVADGLRTVLVQQDRRWTFALDPDRPCRTVEVSVTATLKVGWRAKDGSSQCVGYGAVIERAEFTARGGGTVTVLLGRGGRQVRLWGADSATAVHG